MVGRPIIRSSTAGWAPGLACSRTVRANQADARAQCGDSGLPRLRAQAISSAAGVKQGANGPCLLCRKWATTRNARTCAWSAHEFGLVRRPRRMGNSAAVALRAADVRAQRWRRATPPVIDSKRLPVRTETEGADGWHPALANVCIVRALYAEQRSVHATDARTSLATYIVALLTCAPTRRGSCAFLRSYCTTFFRPRTINDYSPSVLTLTAHAHYSTTQAVYTHHTRIYTRARHPPATSSRERQRALFTSSRTAHPVFTEPRPLYPTSSDTFVPASRQRHRPPAARRAARTP